MLFITNDATSELIDSKLQEGIVIQTLLDIKCEPVFCSFAISHLLQRIFYVFFVSDLVLAFYKINIVQFRIIDTVEPG